jgi:quinol monooxygenase YgiN
MAIALLFGPGITESQYDQVHEEVTPDNKAPAGMLFHVGAQGETGFYVVEVWESQEAAGKFFQDKLGQALQRANINLQPQFLQVHNVMKP